MHSMARGEVLRHRSSFRVSMSRYRNFWERFVEWEPETFRIFDYFIRNDVIFIDVGSWIGPTVLYGAQLAKRTYAFEPDPVAYEELEHNLAINRTAQWANLVKLQNAAIATAAGTIKIGSRADGGDSTSSALYADHQTNWVVKAVTLQDLFCNEKLFGEKIFLKIDIEGGEFELLPSIEKLLQTENVTLYLSIHTNFLSKSFRASSYIGKISRRLRLWYSHFRLCNALRFRYVYCSNGDKLVLRTALIRLFFTGNFPTEIVASKVPWSNKAD